jgi:hypothetical protein
MPHGDDGCFAYLIDVPRAFVLLDCTEPCTCDRLAASIRGVLADPRYEATFTWIADMRHDRGAPDSDTVRAMVAVIDALLAQCSARRWVRVVDRRHPSIFGYARMADAFMETVGWESFSCGTLEEAFAWCAELTPQTPPAAAAAAERPRGAVVLDEPAPLRVLEGPQRNGTRAAGPPDLPTPRPPVSVPDRRRPQGL